MISSRRNISAVATDASSSGIKTIASLLIVIVTMGVVIVFFY